ncbi:MAG TPA: hypothetical protein VFW90_00710 [Candidatus Saccharimonadales bacterium]|nr:hypothetical protein [Candidatus Saccharimonadales bacterium]
MMNVLRKVARVSARAWFILFVISALICVFALRHNNQHMAKLRDAVYVADKNNGNVEKAMDSLRSYVFAHMNTSLSSGTGITPPIQLKYTYQRLVMAKEDEIQQANQNIYNSAASYCRAHIAGTLDSDLLACVQNYAVKHGVTAGVSAIPTGLYEFDFVSPAWSPDLAGWSLITTIALFIAFAIKFLAGRIRHS